MFLLCFQYCYPMGEAKMNDCKRLRISFNAPVVMTFALICLVAYLLNILTQGVSNHLFFSVYRSSFLNPLTYVRCVGHVFGHSNWEHLTGNLMYVLILGPMLEDKYGSSNMVFIMIATAVITGVINIIFFDSC